MKERISRVLIWIFGVGCSIFILDRFVITPLKEAGLSESEKQEVEEYGPPLQQGANSFLRGKSKTLYGIDTKPSP